MNTSTKIDIRNYNNPFKPRWSKESQDTYFPDGTTYTEDKTGKVIEALIRSIRKGSVVRVVWLFLLAPIKGRPSKRREIMLQRLEAIKAKGGIILEAATGIRSDDGPACRRMLLEAHTMMGRSGQGAPGKSKEGRPATPWTKHEFDIMEGCWHSARNKNNDERRAAMRKRLGKEPPGATWLRNKFGPPGRREVADA